MGDERSSRMDGSGSRPCGKLRARLLGLGGALALLATTFALTPGPALAAAVESCNPAVKVATSFCVTYDSSLTSATAHAPSDASFSMSDTSPGFPGTKGTWLSTVTVHLVGAGAPPRITPSAQMPNGLLIAGGGPCTGPAFSNCVGGSGGFVVDVSGAPFDNGIHSGTFGIADIENINPPAPGGLINWALNVNYCVTAALTQFCGSFSTTISGTATNGSLTFSASKSFSQTFNGVTINGDGSIGSITAHLRGRSNALAAGNAFAGGTYTILTMPFTCGPATGSADFTARDARTVSVQLAPLTITGCPAVWAVLPAVTSGSYGGYVTAVTIKNVGNAPAHVNVSYFDQTGGSVGVGDDMPSLPPNGSWTVRQDNGNSFPASGGDAARAGSAVVTSTQPVAAFVNEFAPGGVGDATSYTGIQLPDGAATTLYAPAIANNAYGGYTTGIGLINTGTTATDILVTYRDATGATIKTTSLLSVPAHAYRALYSGDPVLALPDSFAGTATISSAAAGTPQPLAAVITEVGPGGRFSSYDATAFGNSNLFAPVALNSAYGGYFTGLGILNTTATGGTVGITYYNLNGSVAKTVSKSIAANGYLGVYQGDAADGPPVSATGYSAVLVPSAGIYLAAIANELAPAGTPQSTAYNTFGFGLLNGQLPLVENSGSDGWDTSLGVINTGATSTTITVNYYDTATGTPVGTPFSSPLAPNAFLGVYQPAAGLPPGTRATAVVSGSSLDAQFALICNERNPSTFMSYNGQ